MTSPIGQRRANIWSEANEGANPWGGTFHVEWLRLYDLPFQKTVHLKNPLNAFKPVKISRDCQVNILCMRVNSFVSFLAPKNPIMFISRSTTAKCMFWVYIVVCKSNDFSLL